MTIAQGDPGAGELAADPTHAYWTVNVDFYHSELYRAPLDASSGPEKLASTSGSNIRAFALDQDHVYFARSDSEIRSVPKSGGASASIGLASQVESMVVQGGTLYGTSMDGVFKLAVAGGATQNLAQVDDAVSVAVDADWVYFTTESVNFSSGALLKVAKSGGDILYFGPDDAGDPLQLRVTSKGAFWSDLNNRILTAAPGAPQATQLAQTGGDVLQLQADDAFVYYSIPGGLYKVGVSGGSPTKVASVDKSFGFALDEKSVVFADAVTGKVQRIGK